MSFDQDQSKLITAAEAAQLMGYSELTLRKCHNTMSLPKPVKINNRVMWRLDDCEHHIANRGKKNIRRGKPAKMESVQAVSKFNALAFQFLTGHFMSPADKERLEFRKLVARTTGARIISRTRVKSGFE